MSRRRRFAWETALGWLIWIVAGLESQAIFGAEPTVTFHDAPGISRFALVGEKGDKPAATLFIFASDLESTRDQPIYWEVSRLLAPDGVLSVIIDAPCHGADIRAGEPTQLNGWRHRLEQGEDFLKEFTDRASHLLDYLVKKGYTDAERVAACGTSRGGFLAFHLAAADERFRAAAGVAPVTRLLALSEFNGMAEPERAEAFDLEHLAPKLANRAIHLSIGNHDARVDTDAAIDFVRVVTKVASENAPANAILPIELIVAPTAGHTQVDGAHVLLADWLRRYWLATRTAP